MRVVFFFLVSQLMLSSVFATGARGQEGFSGPVELYGRISLESRRYFENAADPVQRSYAGGISAEITAYVEDDLGRSITVTPFVRYDYGDPKRNHFDLREAYLLMYGDAGNNEWELRLGIDRVFWGVVESRSLVDIVNQTNLLEHPNEKTKLGQPMVHATLAGDWGALELFGLTWHRPRAFPGKHGRLRPPLIVDTDMTSYESRAEKWNVDLAARYTNSLGPLDIGLSVFNGTSREPVLVPMPPEPPEPPDDPQVFVPHYNRITQFGLDTQFTSGSWLFKLEAVHRSGAQDSQIPEEDYSAFVVGAEHTIYSIMDSNADLTLFAEWAYDGRGQRATNAFENDIFLAARVGLNDEYDTEFVASIVKSLDTDSRVFGAEFNRRISDNWSLKMEASAFSGVGPDDILLYPVRRDSNASINLDYSF